MPDHPVAKGRTAALVTFRSLALAPYRFDRFRAAKNRRPGLGRMSVVPPAGDEGSYRWARGPARHLAAGIALTRRLGDAPPNVADPSWMAAQAADLAEEHEMECLELGPEELAERGMGGILAVGGGSKTPPRMVRLRWGAGEPSLAFVGKGVTFDSGGLSLKPSPAMDEMKFDKAGACTVLGVARALAGAGVPGRFSCFLPLAENMPDGASYRPGDIVTCYNGKSVEILNTDAEGRMLLADALSWAEEDAPDSVLDFATLTGACVVALGQGGGGLFTPGDGLATELLESAARSGERLWRLPLWAEFEAGLEGRHADLKNVAGRWGGASSAAAFLAQFVTRRDRWAHFDIAGPAYVSKGPKSFGATGFGVATAFDWALRRCGVL
jgi:leucyl aminopeptidase